MRASARLGQDPKLRRNKMLPQPEKHSLAVTVIIETSDARLLPENIDVSTVQKAALLRRLVLDHLPFATRVVMVLHEETARVMSQAHDMAARELGIAVGVPPADYIPPTRD